LIVEFITENYTNNKVFNYEGLSSDYIQKGAIYGGNRMDKNFHPLLQLIAPEYSYVERPLGVAMAPQLSGVLVACFILFLLSIIKHKHYLYFSHHKTIYLSMVILLVALLMSLSGTGMMILMVGSLLLFASKKNIFFIIFLAPLFVYLALFLRGYTYDGAGVFLLTYSLKLFSLFYSNLLSSDFVTLIIGGNTSQTVDIDYLNFIVRFGVIGSALFLLLLFMVYYCWGKAFRHTTMDLPLIPVILSILMANFHYDSIYRYPASFLFFMIIGYISYNYSMSHINYTKRQ